MIAEAINVPTCLRTILSAIPSIKPSLSTADETTIIEMAKNIKTMTPKALSPGKRGRR